MLRRGEQTRKNNEVNDDSLLFGKQKPILSRQIPSAYYKKCITFMEQSLFSFILD